MLKLILLVSLVAYVSAMPTLQELAEINKDCDMNIDPFCHLQGWQDILDNIIMDPFGKRELAEVDQRIVITTTAIVSAIIGGLVSGLVGVGADALKETIGI